MSKSVKQRAFTKSLGMLIMYAYSLGYELTVGDAYRSPSVTYGHPDSTHRHRLAIDLNLFVNGKYITDGSHPAFTELHNYWDKIGGSKRIDKDMNHFSFEHNGIR